MKKILENNKIATFPITNIIPNYKVYKSNKMIECKSDFSAIEHRIIVLALAQITSKDENLKMYRINIRDVLGKKNNTSNYNTVRNAVKKLHKSTIDMEDGKKWKSYSFITKAQGEIGTSFLEIQFHEDVQKFLLNMKSQYTSYTLNHVMKFKKNYSLRIYEICKQYARIGKRRMGIDYLRTLFCLENKHSNFCKLRQKVLNPAIEEINTYSDIFVSFVEKKEGNKVVSIDFFIHRNKKVLNEESARTLEEISLFSENKEKLISIGFDDEYIFSMHKEYGNERINTVLDLFEKNIDTIKFPKAWVENALKENYVDTSVYKKKLSEVKEKHNEIESLMRKKNMIRSKLNDLQYSLEISEQDLNYYESCHELKSSDIMRFDENFTVEQAIDYTNNRIKETKESMNLLKREIEDLEKYLLSSKK